MRILSVVQWDHFANMIISIAMLGFGVSGSILALGRKSIMKHSDFLIPTLMLLSSVLMLLAYRLSQTEALRFDTFLVFSTLDELFKLVIFLFLFFLPFFAASLAIGMIYVKHVSGIGKLYFSNLIGSGIGGIAGLGLLHLFFPETALVIAALFPLIAALVIIPERKPILFYTLLSVLLLLVFVNFYKPVKPVLSQYKSLSKVLLLPDAEIVVEESGISSVAQIVESEFLRFAPGLSLHFIGKVPVKPMAFVNGNAAGFIPLYNQGQNEDILDYSTYKLPYLTGDNRNVAILKSGTGLMVAQALRNNATKIYATESDINLINALKKYEDLRGICIYSNPEVNLVQSEPRAFFNNNTELFDLIVLPIIGSFGGSSGLEAIREDFSITTQAFGLYLDNLSDNGKLAITVYTDFPPRAVLKALSVMTQSLRNYGISEPYKHIVAIRSWTSISFVLFKDEVKDDFITSVKDFCDEMGFDPFILPGTSQEDRVFYNYIEDKQIFELADCILEGNTAEISENYMFYVNAPSDNKPYFSRFIKISKLNELLKEYHWKELPFLELGYIIIWLTFLIALILALVLILTPVAWLRKSTGKTPVLFYFGAIGLGFMFAEIILIQRFVLYLGHPVYAVSAVLSVMLIASGIGSYFSSRLKEKRMNYHIIYIVIFLVLIIYAFFLTGFLSITSGYNIILRIIITIIITAIPAFFMGMPFPIGLKTLHDLKRNELLAWAWGINGFFSVIATPLALIIAVEVGAFPVIIMAAFMYLIAGAALQYKYRLSLK